jgi:hypothetical protein
MPFFRNTLGGDLFFVVLLFGAYEGILALTRKMAPDRQSIAG